MNDSRADRLKNGQESVPEPSGEACLPGTETWNKSGCPQHKDRSGIEENPRLTGVRTRKQYVVEVALQGL